MAKKAGNARDGFIFLLTFLVALALFGGVMAWVMTDFWRPSPAEEGTATTTTTAPAPKKDLRLLLITEDDSEAQGFVVLSAEPTMGRIRVIPIPRETVMTIGTEEIRLYEWYRTATLPTLTNAVGDLFGWELQHYAVMSYTNLQRLVTYLNNGVIYTLTESVTYISSAGNTVTMPSGARTLSATQVTDLLRYSGWHGGRRAKANVQGDIAAAILDQYFVAARLAENATDFQTFVSLTRSNLLASDYAAAHSDLLALARRNNFDIATLSVPRGEFIGVGENMRFEMADSPLS